MSRILLIAMAVWTLAVLVISYAMNEYRYSDGARWSQAAAEMADGWSGEIAFESSYDALVPAAPTAAENAPEAAIQAPGGFNPSDPYGGLPHNEGYELVAGYCGACHSLQLVMQQRRSERRWNELIDWMVNTQNMPAPPPADRRSIVSYLARNYGEGAR